MHIIIVLETKYSKHKVHPSKQGTLKQRCFNVAIWLKPNGNVVVTLLSGALFAGMTCTSTIVATGNVSQQHLNRREKGSPKESNSEQNPLCHLVEVLGCHVRHWFLEKSSVCEEIFPLFVSQFTTVDLHNQL